MLPGWNPVPASFTAPGAPGRNIPFFAREHHMFGLSFVEISVIVVFVAIVVLFAMNMSVEKKSDDHPGEKK